MKQEKEYMLFKTGRKHVVVENATIEHKLPPGAYELEYQNMTKTLIFHEVQFKHDAIVELPSPEYKQIVTETEYFLSKECKDSFKKFGFLYKRSFLLYGKPGTGKSVISNRLSALVIEKGGIVLFTDNPPLIKIAYNRLDSTNADTMVCCVLEEMDEIVKNFEKDLLLLLDGEVQRENVIYLANTNYLNKIPARIRRPGRFSTTIEVTYPNREVREHYLTTKMHIKASELKEWLDKTDGFSIDELKEVTLCVKCLNQSLDSVIAKIGGNRAVSSVDGVNEEQQRKFMDIFSDLAQEAVDRMEDDEDEDEDELEEYNGN